MGKSAKRDIVAYAISGIILVAVDLATKFYAFNSGFAEFLNNFKPVISKRLFSNSDFAFSLKLPQPLMWLIYIFLLAVLITWFWRSEVKSKRMKIALMLILAGAFSNIFDRLILGYVRDFIYIFWGGILNIADIYIIIGIILLAFDTRKENA